MKKILFILLSLLLNMALNSSVLAEVRYFQPPHVIISGVLKGSNVHIQPIKESHIEEINLSNGDANSYKLSADFLFKTIKHRALFEQLPFKVLGNSLNRSEQIRFIFSGQSYIEPQTIKVDFIQDLQNLQDSYSTQKGATISDYEQIWLEYRDLDIDNPTEVSLLLYLEPEIESNDAADKTYILIKNLRGNHDLVEVENEDILKTTWQPKDQLYLFRRTFGLEGDNNWRYVQDGGYVVLQRRFDRAMSDNDAVDLVLDANTTIGGINLRLNTEDGDEVIMEWSSIPKQIEKDSNGNMRVRLLLSELEKIHQHLVLKEILIFIQGSADEIVDNRPLHSIHWMDADKTLSTKYNNLDNGIGVELENKTNLVEVYVNSQIENLSDGNKRLKLDLSSLVRKVGRRSKILLAQLLLQPKNKNKLGGVELSSLRLVSIYDNKMPTIVVQGRVLLGQWGVKLDGTGNNGELNVWPVIYKYSNIQKELIADPLSQWVDLEWKVGKEISEGSYLYLGGKEIQDKVLGIRVTPYSFSGESLGNWFLPFNGSVQLDKFRGNHEGVDYIKIRVYLDVQSGKAQQREIEDVDILQVKRALITEMALFRVEDLSFDEILDASFPLKQQTFLDLEIENMPSNIITTKTQDWRGEGVTFIALDDEPSHGDLFFNTVIKDKNRSEFDSVDFSYEMPWSFPLIDKCWLEFTATGNGKEIQDKVCLDGYSGVENIPLPEWADQIKWRVVLPHENNLWSNLDIDKFYLSVKIHTAITTIREQLLNHPVLTVDGNKLLPIDAKLNKYGGNLYFDLGDTKYRPYLYDIKHLVHPWLEVDKIILDREEPFSIEEWQELNQKKLIEGGGGSFWLQLLKFLSIIFAIWWLISSGWFIKSFRALIALFLSLWNLPVRVLSRFNIKVGWRATFWWWSMVALSLYAGGVLLHGMQAENYYFTFGGMAVVMSWRALVEYCKPSVGSRWPRLSKKVYSGAGTKYFSGFIVIIVGVAVMLMLRLDPIAEQLAVIGYYLLVVGVVLEILDLRKDKLNINKENSAEK